MTVCLTDDKLWWAMTAQSRAFAIIYVASLQWDRRNKKRCDLTWTSLNRTRLPLCMWLILQKNQPNKQKNPFVFASVASASTKSVLLCSACTQLGRITLSVKCELWPHLPYFHLCRELWVRIEKKKAVSRAGQVWVPNLNKVRTMMNEGSAWNLKSEEREF